MLISQVSGPGGGSLRGYGGLAGASDVQALQNALVSYAQATGDNPGANPMSTSGQLNDETVLAAIHVVWKAAGKVPVLKQIQGAINSIPGVGQVVGLVLGNYAVRMVTWSTAVPESVKGQIRSFITSNAKVIAGGVLAAVGLAGDVALPPTTVPTRSWMDLVKTTKDFVGKLNPGNANKLAAFDPGKGYYRVAVKIGMGSTAATHTEVAASPTPPSDATLVDINTFKTAVGDKGVLPYILIGGGVLAAGGLLYWLLK
jgi:hypothetical protein